MFWVEGTNKERRQGKEGLVSTLLRVMKVKIGVVDYYMQRGAVPGMDATWSNVMGEAVQRVPVVRVFGRTPGGQRVCAHVHHVFPYFYVPCGDCGMPMENMESAGQYVRQFALALNAALLCKRRGDGGWIGGVDGDGRERSDDDGLMKNQQQGMMNSKMSGQRVYDALLVKGVPFYGFHQEEQLWIKIMLCDPKDVKPASELLSAGAVFGRKFQPYESHIPYLLQFKIDYNLHGMGWMVLDEVKFRLPVPKREDINGMMVRGGWIKRHESIECTPLAGSSRTETPCKSNSLPESSTCLKDGSAAELWFESKVLRQNAVWDPGSLLKKKISSCELEVDVCASCIANIKEKKFISIQDAPTDMQLVDSLGPIWLDEQKRQGKKNVGPDHPSIERKIRGDDPAVHELRLKFEHADRERPDFALPSKDMMQTTPSSEFWDLPSANDTTQLTNKSDNAGRNAQFNEIDKDFSKYVDADIMATQVQQVC